MTSQTHEECLSYMQHIETGQRPITKMNSKINTRIQVMALALFLEVSCTVELT